MTTERDNGEQVMKPTAISDSSLAFQRCGGGHTDMPDNSSFLFYLLDSPSEGKVAICLSPINYEARSDPLPLESTKILSFKHGRCFKSNGYLNYFFH